MIRGKTVTCVIPVRAGSSGIPGKNVRSLAGRNLLERAVRFALATAIVDRTLVTTDDPEMQAIAASHGVAAPSLRPHYLADCRASTVDVVAHLAADAEIAPGYILLIQVTTPLRTIADLEQLVVQFEQAPQCESAASVCINRGAHPEKLQKIDGGCLVSYLGGDAGHARQTMPKLYALNGAFYLIDRDLLLNGRSFLPPGTLAFRMPTDRSANLDTMTDWLVLEAMLSAGHWTIEDH